MNAPSQAKHAITVAFERALPDQPLPDWDANLTGDIGLDSVQIMNLVMEIEDELDVSVPVEALADVFTLNQLADQVSQLITQES
jgi:acyl carrier protein